MRKPIQPTVIGPEGPANPLQYPEGWKQPGEPVGVSYRDEQRVLAAIVMLGGYVAKTGHVGGTVPRRIASYAAGDLKPVHVQRAIRQLERKGVVLIDNTGDKKVYANAVALVDGSTKADEWAMNELRRLVLARQKPKAQQPEKPPADYEPTYRSTRAAAPQPEPAAAATPSLTLPVVNDLDYGKLADELLVALVAKLNAPAPAPVTKVVGVPKAQFEEARQFAYNLEKENGALKAQLAAIEKNLAVAIQTATDMQQQLDVEKARRRKAEDAGNHRNGPSRSDTIRDRLGSDNPLDKLRGAR